MKTLLKTVGIGILCVINASNITAQTTVATTSTQLIKLSESTIKKNTLSIEGSSTIKSYYYIWSKKGQLIKKGTIPPFEDRYTLEKPDLKSGKYLLEWWSEDRRVVIEFDEE